MQQVTAIQQAISIPRLFPEDEQNTAKRVMAAWAEKQGKHAVFESGQTYIATVYGERYRFQCQRRTENNRYGFQRKTLPEQKLDGILLFRQSEEADNKYLWRLYTPEEILGGKTERRRVISPNFDEDSEDYVIL